MPAPRSATPMTSHADDSALVLRRLPGWAAKPQSVVHRTIAIVLEQSSAGTLTRAELVRLIGERTGSKNPYGVVANLLRSDGNAYGRLLIETDGFLTIHPEANEEVRRCQWYLG